VLRQAARRAAEWGVTISVNVSAHHLRDAGFADSVASALRETGAAPERIRLEVTEQAMSEDAEATLRTLRDVRERLGVRAHLDDFGAGTSSLRFLHEFPGDALKIDSGLVEGMASDPASQEIVKAITGLGHSLGMEVVAEGVVSAAHLEQVRAIGCDFAQGTHVSAPLTAAEARDLLDGRAAGAPV
jgi:EAL domain-containing protein (putative c-di-GMP-specific phosphodiesterase class I)